MRQASTAFLIPALITVAACNQTDNARPSATTAATAAPKTCEQLATLALPSTTISGVEAVAAGAFKSPVPAFGPGADFSKLPAFCRVAGSIKPSPDSDIRFEVWLPAEGWNGKFMQTGNGGAAGSIVYTSLAEPLARGYAVANTDTGHQGGGGDFAWATGHPEKLTDYAYRGVHELTIVGKAVTSARYGKSPERSYWNGCSTGGRQGLKEAQRFPDDYDAIVAGAPANNWSALMAFSVSVQRNMTGPDGLAVNKLGVLTGAALAACDARDGVVDRVIGEPKLCTFDPASTECAAGKTEACLTAPEVAAAKRIYAGVVDKAGAVLMPGTGPASETLWAAYASPQFGIGTSYFRNVVANDPSWDPATFDVDVDVARAEAQEGGRGQSDGSRSLRVLRARRPADHLSRHRGWAHPLRQHGELLRDRRREARRRRGQGPRGPLPRARDEPLQRRRGRVRRRLDRRARGVRPYGQAAEHYSREPSGAAARPARRARDARQGVHAAAVSLSAAREIPRAGRRGGRRVLAMRGRVMAPC
jgi:feruloyl esterase